VRNLRNVVSESMARGTLFWWETERQFSVTSKSSLQTHLKLKFDGTTQGSLRFDGTPSISVATPLWPSVGVKPNTSKVGDLESSGTPECLGFDSKAQNTSH
jgi:hypothetical protein